MKELPEFGSGNDQIKHFWNSLIRQMLLEGLTEKRYRRIWSIEDYQKRRRFFEEAKIIQRSFLIIFMKRPMQTMKKDAEAASGAATDEKLFEMLKELRQKEAKKKNLPPFVIFLETSIQDMATLYPTTLKSWKNARASAKEKH